MTSPYTIVLTHGSTQVAALAKKIGAAELGRRVETSEGMIRHLATGRKNPGPGLKARFESLGIDRGAWTMPAAPGVTEKATLATEKVAARVEREQQASETAIQRLERSVLAYGDIIDFAIRDEAPFNHITGAMAKRDGVLVDLAKLYGEGELTAAAIHRSRVWTDEILPRILRVLKKHPEAARDFAQEFAKPE